MSATPRSMSARLPSPRTGSSTPRSSTAVIAFAPENKRLSTSMQAASVHRSDAVSDSMQSLLREIVSATLDCLSQRAHCKNQEEMSFVPFHPTDEAGVYAYGSRKVNLVRTFAAELREVSFLPLDRYFSTAFSSFALAAVSLCWRALRTLLTGFAGFVPIGEFVDKYADSEARKVLKNKLYLGDSLGNSP